jgi:hypothetical protein
MCIQGVCPFCVRVRSLEFYNNAPFVISTYFEGEVTPTRIIISVAQTTQDGGKNYDCFVKILPSIKPYPFIIVFKNLLSQKFLSFYKP